LILKIPPSIIEIQKRHELTLPLLKFQTDVTLHMREPTLRFLEKLSDLRSLKNLIVRKHMKDTINNFLAVVCPRD
jgi:hypothetical protein